MRVLHILMIILSVSILGACNKMGDRVSDTITMNADYGEYPENYQEIVKTAMVDLLKDPYSAQYRFKTEPFKAYLREAPINGGDPFMYGYMVYVDVNAKNSFGGYVGWKEYRLLIRNGKVVGDAVPHQWFGEAWYQPYR